MVVLIPLLVGFTFVNAGITHLCLALFKGTSKSYEATYRVTLLFLQHLDFRARAVRRRYRLKRLGGGLDNHRFIEGAQDRRLAGRGGCSTPCVRLYGDLHRRLHCDYRRGRRLGPSCEYLAASSAFSSGRWLRERPTSSFFFWSSPLGWQRVAFSG